MSDAQHTPDNAPDNSHERTHTHEHEHSQSHDGPVKTPKQLILAVLYAFVVPVVMIVMLVEYVTSEPRPAAGTQALTPAAVAQRIQPVGMVQVKDAADLSTLKTGDQVYTAQCSACHAAGLVGAPKFGDVAAWSPRIKTGYDALVKSALVGKGSMGAQGGGDFTDLEIGRAVVYMTNQAGAKFDEPKPPAAGAPAPAATTAAAPAAVPVTPVAAAAPATPMATGASMAAPVAVAVATVQPSKAGAVPALYTQMCQTCHVAGVAGAPKVGDKAAWATRLVAAKDIDGLTASAIKGKGAMPPRGGSTASDTEIKAVVAYMVEASK